MAPGNSNRGRPAALLALIAGALWLAPPLPEDSLRRAAHGLRGKIPGEGLPGTEDEGGWEEDLKDALTWGRPGLGGETNPGAGQDALTRLPPPEEMPEFSGSWRGYRLENDGTLFSEASESGAWSSSFTSEGSVENSIHDSPGAVAKTVEGRAGGSGTVRRQSGKKAKKAAKSGEGSEGKESGNGTERKKEVREKNLKGWDLRKFRNGLKTRKTTIDGRLGRNRPRPRAQGRFRPILLSKLLGLGSIRPPPDDLTPPKFSFPERIPDEGPLGEKIPGGRPAALDLESVRPPVIPGRCGKKIHWHADSGGALRHEGPLWGHWARQRWSWLLKHERRWWLEVPPQAREGADVPPLARQGNHWWWKAGGRWFLLHQGEPWAYRSFESLRSEGLIHPETGTRMIYSADAKRVAVVTPGLGAVLFDAETGTELARWTEGQMPKPRRPAAPKTLSFEPAK